MVNRVLNETSLCISTSRMSFDLLLKLARINFVTPPPHIVDANVYLKFIQVADDLLKAIRQLVNFSNFHFPGVCTHQGGRVVLF